MGRVPLYHTVTHKVAPYNIPVKHELMRRHGELHMHSRMERKTQCMWKKDAEAILEGIIICLKTEENS